MLWFRISEPINLPPYASQVKLYRLFRMGDTKMDNFDDLIDYNKVDPFAPITETARNAPNKGEEGLPDEDDCTFDNEQQEQHQSKYGDSIFYEPYVTKPPRGSVAC